VSGLHLSDLPDVASADCPIKFLCTEDEAYKLLSNLDITKANGPNDNSARILKETALSNTPIATHMFNISITLGELPDEWKTACIPKSDDHSDPRYTIVQIIFIEQTP